MHNEGMILLNMLKLLRENNMKKENIYPFFNESAILFPVLLLASIGVIMVYSASSAISITKFGNNIFYLQKQSLFFLISLLSMILISFFPYKYFKFLAYLFLLISIVLLIIVQIPSIGIKAGGAYRWLRFGLFTFQPSEFTKFAFIIFLAYSLDKKQSMIKDFSVGFIPHVIIFIILAILIMMQPDFGSVIILGLITWGMMFIAGVRIIHLLIPLPFLIPFFYFFLFKVGYRMERIFAFLNPWEDPLNAGYQITHSLKAFGSGGIFGKGIGLSMQKLYYLPEPHTDFIFSVIGEELGLVGVFLILMLYSIILWRGINIASNCKNFFATLLAFGLTLNLGIQVIINIGVTLGVLPTKGLTLPFLSYGGTSLLVNMIAMGILMNIGTSKDMLRKTENIKLDLK